MEILAEAPAAPSKVVVFVSLPTEILLKIMKNLDGRGLAAVTATNKFLQSIANDQMIWKNLCRFYAVFSDFNSVQLFPKSNLLELEESSQHIPNWKQAYITFHLKRLKKYGKGLFALYPPQTAQIIQPKVVQIPLTCLQCEIDANKDLITHPRSFTSSPRDSYLLHTFTNNCELRSLISDHSPISPSPRTPSPIKNLMSSQYATSYNSMEIPFVMIPKRFTLRNGIEGVWNSGIDSDFGLRVSREDSVSEIVVPFILEL